nr:hypothetical protein [Tanacetum cinerariifolium]
YEVEHKDHKKRNEMYYPRFIKVIIHHFMSKDPSIPRRNKFGALLLIEFTNEEIRNSNVYKEYYVVATGAAPPKPKASVRKTRSSFDTSITPPTTAVGLTLTTSGKGKQEAKAFKAKSLSALSEVAMTEAQQLKLVTKKSLYKTYISQASGSGADEGTGSIPGVPDVPIDESEEELSWNSTEDEGPRLTTSVKGKQAAKASKAKSLSALSKVAITEAQQIKLVTNRSLQKTHISQTSGSGADEGTGSIPGVLDVPTDESEEELSWNSTDEEGDDDEGKDGDGDEEDDGEEGDGDDDDEDDDGEEGDDDDDDQEVERDDEKDDEEEGGDEEQDSDEEEFIYRSLSTHAEEEPRDEESFDPILRTPKNSDDEGNGEENIGLNVGREEGHDKEEEEDELYIDVNINQGRVALLPMSAPTITPSTIATITTTQQAPLSPTTAPSTLFQDLPNFGLLFGFDNRLRTLEANFSEFMQTNQFGVAVSAIPGIVQRYMDQQMNEAVKVSVQIQSNRLCDEAQKENDEFLKTIDENMQKINKEQVKEQVKTSYAVAADLSEMELKKILIEKMEGNKSIQRSDEQRNLYKALVEAYESDKIILDTYTETVTLKRRRDDDADKDEEPSAGPDGGSKRRREGKELESASAPTETATRSAGRSTQGTRSRQTSESESATHPEWFSQQQKSPTPGRDWNKTLPTTHLSIQPWIIELTKQSDSRSSFNKLMDTPLDFSNFLINRLKADTLTPELIAGPTYELLNGSCKSLVELEYHLEEVCKATIDQLDWVNPEGQQYPHNLLKPLPLIPNNQGRRVISFEHFINNDLEYLRGGASSRKYTASVTKKKAADYGHIKWIEDLVPRIMWIEELIGYDKHALWESPIGGVNIVEWHNYKHLDWITVRRDDDKLYKFKEGDFRRLRIQDIEDMLLLLVQGKFTNPTVEERFAFNVSLRMFTRSIVIQRRVEDLQLGVESYQKKLNLTKLDTYRSDLKHKEAYIAYSNPRGFIYQNKDKKNSESYALSWKPCQGDSLNLPDHRYIADVAASFQRSQFHNIKLSMSNHCWGRLYSAFGVWILDIQISKDNNHAVHEQKVRYPTAPDRG